MREGANTGVKFLRMIWLSVRRQWLLVTALALIFFVGNLVLLSKFSGTFQHVMNNVPSKVGNKGDTLDFLIGNSARRTDDYVATVSDKEKEPGISTNIGGKVQHMNSVHPLESISSNAKNQHRSIGPVTQEKRNPNTIPQLIKDKFKIAILVIACNRPSVGRCLDQLLNYKPSNVDLPILVSQDCGDEATAQVIQSYGKKVKHLRHPHLGDVAGVPLNMRHFMGYYKISRHYKWALTQAFGISGVDSVIVVEDDLDIAPDFYEYFLATRPLLDQDPSLYCVSAWNDNGKEEYVQDNGKLYRTDFFPGLGWMLTKNVWKELKPRWPKGFWDDWMRHTKTRNNRACISPEVSRTKTFGRVGVSMGQFFDQYLKFIKLNKEPYPFLQKDLSYLLKQNYDKPYLDMVYKLPEVSLPDVLQRQIKEGPVRVTYGSNQEFEQAARQIGIMSDLKAGVPRMAYRGIVTFVRHGVRVYLSPPIEWAGYVEN